VNGDRSRVKKKRKGASESLACFGQKRAQKVGNRERGRGGQKRICGSLNCSIESEGKKKKRGKKGDAQKTIKIVWLSNERVRTRDGMGIGVALPASIVLTQVIIAEKLKTRGKGAKRCSSTRGRRMEKKKREWSGSPLS